MGKYLTARNIAEEFGETSRHWTKLAAAGAVPGARQPKDKATWLFDLDTFRAWHAKGQPRVETPAPAKAPAPGRTGGSSPKAVRRKAEFDAEIDRLVRGALKKPADPGR